MPTTAQTIHKHGVGDEYLAPSTLEREQEVVESALEESDRALEGSDNTLHALDGTVEQYNSYKKTPNNQVGLGTFSEGRAPLYSSDNGMVKVTVLPENDTMQLETGVKPPVGSEAWHRQRRSNHKEVERRRRETINESISELARIVPGCEKNKGKILERTVTYIQQLKENEANNIEKWTLEKLLTDQAISELSATNQKLKAECDRLWREMNVWKQAASCAGKQDNDSNKDEPISNVRAEKMD
ncbi:hypothetical protein PCANB_001095 [Pneumocystis canis]|nr:hypothetical protein PCK1_001070 [Pneumocystis canis]KAG5437302.1 hypothetical protein PCANB_001095 [Pneumocystis canis]